MLTVCVRKTSSIATSATHTVLFEVFEGRWCFRHVTQWPAEDSILYTDFLLEWHCKSLKRRRTESSANQIIHFRFVLCELIRLSQKIYSSAHSWWHADRRMIRRLCERVVAARYQLCNILFNCEIHFASFAVKVTAIFLKVTFSTSEKESSIRDLMKTLHASIIW